MRAGSRQTHPIVKSDDLFVPKTVRSLHASGQEVIEQHVHIAPTAHCTVGAILCLHRLPNAVWHKQISTAPSCNNDDEKDNAQKMQAG